MIKLRFRSPTSARDTPAVMVAVVVSILFLFGAVYFYRIPVATLRGYLFNLLLILLVLMLVGLLLAGLVILARRVFSRD